jgi:hypothetical protein
VAKTLCAQIEITEQDLAVRLNDDCVVMRSALQDGRLTLEAANDFIQWHATWWWPKTRWTVTRRFITPK